MRRENIKGAPFMRQVCNHLRELSYVLYQDWLKTATKKRKEVSETSQRK